VAKVETRFHWMAKRIKRLIEHEKKPVQMKENDEFENENENESENARGNVNEIETCVEGFGRVNSAE
jgi:hypothetical protein